MAVRQFYRGNPAEKQYVLSQNFVGGLNTRAADDVVTDIEFRELLNADLGDQGVIRNRNGFKDLVIFNSMIETLVDEKGDAASFPEGVYRFAKVVNDPQKIISQLTEYETIQEFRQALQPIAYDLKFLFLIDSEFYRLKISKQAGQLNERSELERQLQLTIKEEKDIISDIVLPSNDSNIVFTNGVSQLEITLPEIPEDYELESVILETIEYQVLAGAPLEGELRINFPVQTNSENPQDALIYTDVNLPNTNYSFLPIPGFEDFNLDIKRDFFGVSNAEQYFGNIVTPSRFVDYKNANGTQNQTLFFRFVVRFTFVREESLVDAFQLEEFKSKTSVSNVDFLDSVYTFPGDNQLYEYNIVEDKVKRVEAEQPTVYMLKFIGFNVLADNPLTFIADQGGPIKSIEGFFLTRDGNKPMQSIDGGRFQLNVIHEGINFTTDELGIEFFINFNTEEEQQIKPLLVSAQDVGGLFIFEFNAVGLSGFAGEDLTIRLFELDKSEGSDLTEDVSFADATPVGSNQTETIIKVEDTAVFVVNQDYVIAQPGAYQRVRIKEIVDTETLLIFGRVGRTFLVDEGARIYKEKEKTENITFNPFLDVYPIVSGLAELLRPVERLNLQGFKIIEIGNRLVYYGRKEIWFSDINKFGYIPNFNVVTLPLSTTDEIQRIVFFRGFHIVFTKDEIYRIVGLFGSPNFRIETVNKFIGCIAPKTVRNVGNELFFLSRDGLYKLKSSVFQDNLENVEKIDKAISDQVQISEFVDSLLYDEQYILYYNEGEEYDTLRMFYDIDLGKNRNPFVRDIFTLKPTLLVKDSGNIFALNNGRWFVYGEGFTDFMPDGTEDSTPYTYPCRIETPSLALGFPTHQKKFKNIFIKALHGDKVIPLFMTVKVDNYDVLLPSDIFAFVNELGEVEYSVSTDPNIILETSAFLGDLELGVTALGELTQKVHKLSFSGKGKNIKLIIEQQTDASFGIVSIGYLYKLGKVKE